MWKWTYKTESWIPFFAPGKLPVTVAVSGGRTSALMWVLAHEAHRRAGAPAPLGAFANTGREVSGTYEFLRALGERHPFAWLEYRAPRPGAPPKDATQEIVTFETADRTGAPFSALLKSLADYRKEVKGLGPTRPGFKVRICTAHLKMSPLQRHFFSMVGENRRLVGLRADEPDRWRPLHGVHRSGSEAWCPLALAGITEVDVKEFWKMQDFDLGIPRYRGNCDGCFLKSEQGVYRSFAEDIADGKPSHNWWIEQCEKYGSFRGDRTSYSGIIAESSARAEVIRAAAEGRDPVWTEALGVTPRRLELLRRQEARYLAGDPDAASCTCEAGITSSLGSDVD